MRRKYLLCLLLSAVFVILCVVFLPFHYESNDDIGMIGILSGKTTGSPDFHSVFMNVILGYPLSWLYGMTMAVEWYTLLFLLVHVLSCAVIAWFVLKHLEGIVIKVTALLFLCVLEMRLLNQLQFTTTAGLAASAALLLICDNGKVTRAIGVALFVVSSLIRFDAAMLAGMAFVFAYPLLVRRFGFDKRQFVSLCICVLVAFSCKCLDKMAYRHDPEWSYYYDYNKVRGKLNDNPNAWRVVDDLPQGIDSESYMLLTWFFFPDSEVLNLKVLKEIEQNINKDCSYKGIPAVKKLKNIPFEFMKYKWVLMASVMMGVMAFVWSKHEKWRWLLLPVLLCLPVIVAIVALNAHVKQRAFLCAFVPWVFVFLYVGVPKIRNWRMKVMGCVLIGLSFFLFFPMAAGNDYSTPKKERCLQEMAKSAIILGDGGTCLISPWEVRNSCFRGIGTGWYAMMPHCRHLTYKDLIDDETMTIAIESDLYDCFCGFITQSIKVQYHKDVEPMVIKKNDLYILFRLITKTSDVYSF